MSTESDWSRVLATHRPSGVVHFAAHYAASAALAYNEADWSETIKAKALAWRALHAAIESAPAAHVQALDFVATTT